MTEPRLPLPAEPSVPAGYEELAVRVQAQLSPPRYRHVLGVTAIARAVAAPLSVHRHPGTLAALLHGLAREAPPTRLRELARQAGHPLPPADASAQAHMAELHAPAGAWLAQIEFGIGDDVILDAIRHHTYGEVDLDPVGAVLYIAD